MSAPKKLTARQEAAITALLAEPTQAAAAAKCGASEPTLRRWLKSPRFRRAFLDARRQVVDGVVSQLQRAATKAVKALERNLDCQNPATEVRAALGVLEQTFRGVELLDLAERIEELERRQQLQERQPI
jgi:hypothetical protein